jgi:hypothetical protein
MFLPRICTEIPQILKVTTPLRGGLNGDPKRVHEKTILTAETLRTQSLLFNLFSFERKENKPQALRLHRMLIKACFYWRCHHLHCHQTVRSFLFWPLTRKEKIFVSANSASRAKRAVKTIHAITRIAKLGPSA